jgi:hypothetical protein
MKNRRLFRFALLAPLLVAPCSLAAPSDRLSEALERIPRLSEEAARPADVDWLVRPVERRAGVFRGEHPDELVLTNGLVRRIFRVRPAGATVALDHLVTGESILRGVKPEARIEIDGEAYDVGGLLGQEEHAYLRPEWLDSMTADPAAFRLVSIETGPTRERFPWKRKRWSAGLPWPPPGVAVTFRYLPPEGKLVGLDLGVHYEMFDGIPLVAKWLTIRNGTGRPVRLNRCTSEILAVVDWETSVEATPVWDAPNLHVETDYAFHGMTPKSAARAVHWVPDPQYTSQVNYRRLAPVLLECRPPLGPDATIEPGEEFESLRAFVLAHDSSDRERRGLAIRRMYRTIAPWATENPILMHVRSADPDAVRLAVDQCAEVGFEMVILTFWSGFDAENDDPAYVAGIRELADYAHARGIELGGYSLLASRSVSDEIDVIHPETGKPGGAIFGHSPCLGTDWADDYFAKLRRLFETAGLDVLEHDGSYPGDVCASTDHPGHRGLDDSQWMQWRKITDFYKGCRARGVYLNVPDWYFLSGSSKTGMGYRESNWSLPRERQILLGRQNIFDGTWLKTPSMGWMFVPLVEYQGGGEAATLEPLSEHLDAYEAHLAQNFGSGVQACYRGPRLFDTEETKAVVKKWVDFYKRYRTILDSDIVHVRRADARDVDCMLHVNPFGSPRGLAMVYNPLDREAERTLRLPLYYTGLDDEARIREREGPAKVYRLDRRYEVEVSVTVPSRGGTWLVIDGKD